MHASCKVHAMNASPMHVTHGKCKHDLLGRSTPLPRPTQNKHHILIPGMPHDPHPPPPPPRHVFPHLNSLLSCEGRVIRQVPVLLTHVAATQVLSALTVAFPAVPNSSYWSTPRLPLWLTSCNPKFSSSATQARFKAKSK